MKDLSDATGEKKREAANLSHVLFLSNDNALITYRNCIWYILYSYRT